MEGHASNSKFYYKKFCVAKARIFLDGPLLKFNFGLYAEKTIL